MSKKSRSREVIFEPAPGRLSNPMDVIGSLREIYEAFALAKGDPLLTRPDDFANRQLDGYGSSRLVRERNTPERTLFGGGPFMYDKVAFHSIHSFFSVSEENPVLPVSEHYKLYITDGMFSVTALEAAVSRIGDDRENPQLTLNMPNQTRIYDSAVAESRGHNSHQVGLSHRLFPVILTALKAAETELLTPNE